MRNIILITLFSISAIAQIYVQKQDTKIINLLSNPGFENAKSDWTSSSSATTTIVSGTNAIKESASLKFISTVTGQSVSSSLYALPLSLSGSDKNCYSKINYTTSGTTYTHKVLNQSGTTIASVSLGSTSSVSESALTFVCTVSATTSVRQVIQAGATSGTSIVLDNMHLGSEIISKLDVTRALQYEPIASMTATYPLSISGSSSSPALSLNAVPLSLGGTSNTTFTQGSVIFASGTQLTEDNAYFYYDPNTSRFRVGTGLSSISVSGTTKSSGITISGERGGNDNDLTMHRHSSTLSPINMFIRSRGNEASPLVVQNADVLGDLSFVGYDGTDYDYGAKIDSRVDGTPGSGDMPASLNFYTVADGSNVVSRAMKIGQNKQITLDGHLNGVLITDTTGLVSASKVNLATQVSGTLPVANGGSQWTTSGSAIYYNTGKVGIGTVAPSDKLHIYTSANSTPLVIENAGSTSTQMVFKSSTATDYSRRLGLEGDNLSFFTSGTVRLAINSVGNISVGGAINGTGLITSTTGVSGTRVYAGAGTASLPSFAFSTDAATGMWQPSSGSAALSTAGLERVRVTSGGNIGVGTTTPISKIQIETGTLGTSSGDVVEMQRLSGLASTNGINLDLRNVRTSAGSDWTAVGSRIQQKVDNTWMGYLQFGGDNNNSGISLATGSTAASPGNVTERMRILATGSVGIGTSSPVGTLHVRGGTSYGVIMIGDNGGTSNHHLSHEADGSFGIFTGTFGSGTRQFTITSGGAVGIGTTNPNTRLDVVSTSAGSESSPLTVTNNSSSANTEVSIKLAPSSSPSNRYATISAINAAGINDIDVSISGSTGGTLSKGLTVNSIGRVGIGTSSPTSRLEVSGTVKLKLQPTIASGSVITTDSSGSLYYTDAGVAGQVLTSNGSSGAPTWSNISATTSPFSHMFISSSTTLTSATTHVSASASGGPYTVVMPPSSSTGTVLTIVKSDSTSHVITLSTQFGQTVESSSTSRLNTIGESASFISSGGTWVQTHRTYKTTPLGSGTITITATSVNPTKGAGDYDNVYVERINGTAASIKYKYRQGVAGTNGTGDYLFTLPFGLRFDLTKVYASTSTNVYDTILQGSYIGNGHIGNGANTGQCVAIAYDVTRFRMACVNSFTSYSWFGSGSYALGGGSIGFSMHLQNVDVENWLP
jgi:hypothetical protein